MSNMYGYSDYNGPNFAHTVRNTSNSTDLAVEQTNKDNLDDDRSSNDCATRHDNDDGNDDDDDNNNNPLQVGFWMEGDSMAPPCGTSISTIHDILHNLTLTSNDVLYDLGCGDGRICIEAYYSYHCTAIGIEVESDLVERAQSLITKLSSHQQSSQKQQQPQPQQLPQIHCMDLRQIFHEWLKHSEGGTEESAFPLPTIIFLYLLPEALLEIASSLSNILQIAPSNCRIVCNTWGIPNWKAIQEKTISERSAAGVSTNIYVYTKQSLPNEKGNPLMM